MMEGIAESTRLAAQFGFTPEQFWGALEGGPLAAPHVKAKLDMIAQNDFAPQMQLNHALKDTNLALEAADGQALPALAKIYETWKKAAAEGFASQDLTSIYAWLSEQDNSSRS